jgi:hypothetical protein
MLSERVILSEAKEAMAAFRLLRFAQDDTHDTLVSTELSLSPYYLPATISRTRAAVSGASHFRIR